MVCESRPLQAIKLHISRQSAAAQQLQKGAAKRLSTSTCANGQNGPDFVEVRRGPGDRAEDEHRGVDERPREVEDDPPDVARDQAGLDHEGDRAGEAHQASHEADRHDVDVARRLVPARGPNRK